MCGRYALNLAPSQVRQMLMDQNMAVDDYPADEGEGAPRQSYNFAPGYHGIVYRADTPDWGAGHREHPTDEANTSPKPTSTAALEADETSTDAAATQYKLQSMKWGLIPFWTKRNPDYGTLMRTINCRDDSLSTPGGMWATMKARKRCIVIAAGFYEWLKTGPKDKLPHFIRRRDGGLMCFAGLWDCVKYDDSEEKTYTYTIITTDSNKQMRFIHDRMPVILNPGSEQIRTWLDPQRHEWSKELQSLLRPFEGELDIYPVSKDVGKVGNDSPSFIIPLDSKENKSNIANFFANAEKKKDAKETKSKAATEESHVREEIPTAKDETTNSAKKRQAAEENTAQKPPLKKQTTSKKISATKNESRSPKKSANPAGSQKITKFFGNSA